MLIRPNPGSGVPIYLQMIEQIKHAIETGALRPGEQLPGIRRLAEDLIINPNTIAKAYRELEHDGVIELRQGTGAFVAENGPAAATVRRMSAAQPLMSNLLSRLRESGLGEQEIRRLFESELMRLSETTLPARSRR
jgi:GntR family transcriptional regulator